MLSTLGIAKQSPTPAAPPFSAANDDGLGWASAPSQRAAEAAPHNAFLVAGAMQDVLVARLRGAGYAARGVACFDHLEPLLCPETHSGVVLDLTDLTPGEISDLSIFIRARRCSTGILCLTGAPRVSDVVRLLQAGAFDVLPTAPLHNKFFTSIQTIADRASRWRRHVSEIESYRQNLEDLSVRERQIFALMLESSPTRQIAAQLGLSPRTVDIFRAAAGRKMLKRPLAQLMRLSMLSESHAANGQAGIPDLPWWRP